MKNGGKNKSVAFIFLFSVFLYVISMLHYTINSLLIKIIVN